MLKNNVKIRKVVRSDEKQILDLSNNPEIRKISFNTKRITKDEHALWLNQKLADNNCLFLIADISNSVVGQMRFDVINKEAIISISVHPHYQGCGIGFMLFKNGILELRMKYPSVQNIVALVKKENTNSQLFFKNIGFIEDKTKKIENNILKYNYELSK